MHTTAVSGVCVCVCAYAGKYIDFNEIQRKTKRRSSSSKVQDGTECGVNSGKSKLNIILNF